MFEWLKEKYRKKMMLNHIGKEHCFVFPILPKSCLKDGKNYETFDFSHEYWRNPDYWYTEYKTKTAQWCAEKDCFIDTWHLKVQTLTYEEFKPLREHNPDREEINYGICSYNPCDINQLDLEEIKRITFDLNDDNVESDEIWEKFIKYFEDRGF